MCVNTQAVQCEPAWRVSCQRIREYNHQLRHQDIDALSDQLRALFEFYSVEMRDPQSFDDLADRLRNRYLPGLSWQAVRQRFAITDNNKPVPRVIAIAREFVLGFNTTVPVRTTRIFSSRSGNCHNCNS